MIGGKIKLVPPLELSLWRQWHPAGCLAADQITAHRDERLAAFWPEHGDVISCPRSPIEPRENCLLNLESIHQSDGVQSNDRWLAIAKRVTGKKTRSSIPAQIRDDHPVSRRCQQRGNIDKAVNVVRPAVQKNDGRAIGRTGFGVANIQEASINLLQWAERCVLSGGCRIGYCRRIPTLFREEWALGKQCRSRGNADHCQETTTRYPS